MDIGRIEFETEDLEIKKLLLLVDDDPVMNYVHKRMAIRHGLHSEPVVLERPAEALDFLRKHHQEYEMVVLLLDINMPEMNGWEFLDEVSRWSLRDKIYVFILTSSLAQEDMNRSQEYALVKDYITKPLDEEKSHGIKNNEAVRSFWAS